MQRSRLSSIPAFFAHWSRSTCRTARGAEVTPIPQTVPSPTVPASVWPAGYFEQTAGALAGEDFERPPQGELPVREDW